MRKITQQAINAFMESEPRNWRLKNMEVEVESDTVILYLHWNAIAKRDWTKLFSPIRISNAGWFSTTTKERLKGIRGVSIQQKKGIWYLNWVEWNGNWIAI